MKVCTSTHAALVIHNHSIVRKTYYAALILIKGGQHIETYVYNDDTPIEHIEYQANKAKDQLMQIGFNTNETLRIMAHWLSAMNQSIEVFSRIYGDTAWK
jgi:hypothetical protein